MYAVYGQEEFMGRIKLTVAYDGTNYHGLASYSQARATIEGELNKDIVSI